MAMAIVPIIAAALWPCRTDFRFPAEKDVFLLMPMSYNQRHHV